MKTPCEVTTFLDKSVVLNNQALLPFLTKKWNEKTKEELTALLQSTLQIKLNSQGFMQSAERGDHDPTNYNAIWVRDSVWGYYGLKAQGKTAEAKQLLLSLCRYFSMPHQLERLEETLKEPAALNAMSVLHIRFNGQDEELGDIKIDHVPQYWNHKQNDALGIFYLALVNALHIGEIPWSELDKNAFTFVLKLPEYFSQIDYSNMPDAGSWEELERINTSSIALVLQSLETLQEALKTPRFIEELLSGSEKAKLDFSQCLMSQPEKLQALIDKGYERVLKQLPFESPLHSKDTLYYREADAALLNLLFPCQLKRIPTQELLRVLETVEILVGKVGIKRYLKDAYQSANYWVKTSQDAGLKHDDACTDDCSDFSDFELRTRKSFPDTEAEWFFDSWVSYGIGQLLKRPDIPEEKVAKLKEKQTHYLHRALGQITEAKEVKETLGADGKAVPGWALPESYNTLISESGERRHSPSPIIPLNWAKATLSLAILGTDFLS